MAKPSTVQLLKGKLRSDEQRTVKGPLLMLEKVNCNAPSVSEINPVKQGGVGLRFAALDENTVSEE